MSYETRPVAEKAAERNAKIDALQHKLTTAVQSLVTGEDWRRAIAFAAHFRSRSFNNTLLILVQHSIAHDEGRVPDPQPTFVAGYQQWRLLGRNVMKGQAGYQILAPVTTRLASAEPDNASSWQWLGRGEKPAPGETVRSRIITVKPAYVWDISMTHGPPLAELPRPQLLTGQAPEGMWDGLAKIVAETGFTLHTAPDAASLGGANGITSWADHTVRVRADMDDASRARTLAHEVGHIVLHNRDNTDAVTHRGIAEVEAESVALMIGAAHGMDTVAYTIPYVSGWATQVPNQDPVKTIQDTASRVRAAALGILDRLDTVKTSDGNPPGLEQARTRATMGQLRPLGRQTPTTTRHIEQNGIAMDQLPWCGKELAHVRLHGPDNLDATRHRGVGEVEAESVALMIGAAHGMDTSDYSLPYISTWASRDEGLATVRATGTRVIATARRVLDELPTTQWGSGQPPGLQERVEQQRRDAPTLHARRDRQPARSMAGVSR